jgi:23S rRNA (cytidine1920-2'-O)/16S rRNA (cytidine1409-2'-O)-methyltransferase
MNRSRLDELVVARGLVESREKARRLILAGEVRVNSQVVDKAGAQVFDDVLLELAASPPYVSRGGLKLEHALREFEIDVTGLVAADVGASTGGFTDCLLQHGAERVYALDVGHGQLDWRLRQDPRVIVQEKANVRYIACLPEPVQFVSVDVSFISLRMVLPVIAGWLTPPGQVVALVKPQFEVGRALVGKGGVVRDPLVHRDMLLALLSWAGETRWGLRGLTMSPLLGPAGNREFLAWLSRGTALTPDDLLIFVERALSMQPQNKGT